MLDPGGTKTSPCLAKHCTIGPHQIMMLGTKINGTTEGLSGIISLAAGKSFALFVLVRACYASSLPSRKKIPKGI